MDNKELAKHTALLQYLLDAEGRRYIYSELADETYDKAYTYMDINRRLLGFANETLGSISDCYILYAIAMLGVADRQTIQLFLKNMKARNSDLFIEDTDNDKNIKQRMRILKKYGFVFSISYEYMDASDKKGVAQYPNTLHTIDPEACNLVNEKLSKRIPYNKWIQAKQMPELLGWACAAYVGTNISFHKNFKIYMDGAFRNRNLGTFFFPCELKFDNGENQHYVAVIDSYLYWNRKTQTERDFDDFRALKINAIRNYITNRTKKGIAHIVICVADRDDLYAMRDLIVQSGVLIEYLQHIRFTGEGILQNTARLEDAFLQLYVPEDTDGEATFFASTPVYLK